MRVLVAGATGDIGVPLVRRLVSAGHEWTGMSRRAKKRSMLERLGASSAVADALDARAVAHAVAESRPEVFIHAMTALPRRGPSVRGTSRPPTVCGYRERPPSWPRRSPWAPGGSSGSPSCSPTATAT